MTRRAVSEGTAPCVATLRKAIMFTCQLSFDGVNYVVTVNANGDIIKFVPMLWHNANNTNSG